MIDYVDHQNEADDTCKVLLTVFNVTQTFCTFLFLFTDCNTSRVNEFFNVTRMRRSNRWNSHSLYFKCGPKIKLPQALALIREALGAQRLKVATHEGGHVVAVFSENGKVHTS